MSLGHAILGFLDRAPMTGYELKTRCFDGTVAHFWTADQAQIYRTLERLEAKGLVSSEVDVQFGKPDRRVYTLSSEGREELLDWLSEPRPLPAVRDPFLVQLFFSGMLEEDDVLGLLDTARIQHQTSLESLRRRASERESKITGSPRRKREAATANLTLEAAVARERSTIDWLDDCADTVRRGLPGSATGHSRQLLEK